MLFVHAHFLMNFRVIPEAPTMKIAKGELIPGM